MTMTMSVDTTMTMEADGNGNINCIVDDLDQVGWGFLSDPDLTLLPPGLDQCCQVLKLFPASTSKRFGQFWKKFGKFHKKH